jgi:hypothetical protein
MNIYATFKAKTEKKISLLKIATCLIRILNKKKSNMLDNKIL